MQLFNGRREKEFYQLVLQLFVPLVMYLIGIKTFNEWDSVNDQKPGSLCSKDIQQIVSFS